VSRRRAAPERPHFLAMRAALAGLLAAMAGCSNTAPMEESPRDDVSRLNAQGVELQARGDLDGAEGRFAQALALGRAIDDLSGQARALYDLALIHQVRGSADRALEEVRLSRGLFGEAEDREGGTRALAAEGAILLAAGKLDDARAAYDRALAEAKGASRVLRAEVLTGFSALHLARNDAGRAAEAAREAASLAGEGPVRADALSNLAQAQSRSGDLAGARATLLEVLELDRAADRRGRIADTLRLLAAVAGKQGDRAAAARFEERAKGVAEALERERAGKPPPAR
jgi:tetratricopeptide (TPR) repeat protein